MTRARLCLTASVLALASPAGAGENVTYSYDALGRLTGSSVEGGPTSAIGYDAAGNRSIYAASVPGAPAFSISSGGALEGGGLVFAVVKNGTGAASVVFTTANGTAGSNDYYGASGTLNFAADENSKTVTLALIDDAIDELNETIEFKLMYPSAGATITDPLALGTIFDNDDAQPPPPPPPPVFSVSDASAMEGGILQFTVTKTGATTGNFGVVYEAIPNSATASWNHENPGDFYRTSSSLHFAPNETSKTISIATFDDGLDENNETLLLNLSTTGGATLSDAQGVGTIVDNDDPLPPPPAGNAAPIPDNDYGSIGKCRINAFDVLDGDTDPDGHSLTIIGVTGYGFSFTATHVWVDSNILSGDAQGVYTVSDGHGGFAQATLAIEFTGAGNCNN